MQDQAAEAVCGNGAAKQPPWSEDRLLTDEVIEAAWAQTFRQGCLLLQLLLAVMPEEVHRSPLAGITLLRRCKDGRLGSPGRPMCGPSP